MAAIYPYKWAGQFPNSDSVMVAKDEWFCALEDLLNRHIDRGLMKCRKDGGDFPPSIPEFRKMCFLTPQDRGVLDCEVAYLEFLDGNLSNRLVAEADKNINSYDFKMANMKESRKMFMTQYKICVDKYLAQTEEGQEHFIPLEDKKCLELPKNLDSYNAEGGKKFLWEAKREQIAETLAKQNSPWAMENRNV